MDLDDLFESKGRHRRERWHHGHRDDHHGSHHDDHSGGRPYAHGRRTDVARLLLRAVTAKPGLLAAAMGVLLLVLVAGIWASVLLLGYIGDHGLRGLLEAVRGLGARIWEGGA